MGNIGEEEKREIELEPIKVPVKVPPIAVPQPEPVPA